MADEDTIEVRERVAVLETKVARIDSNMEIAIEKIDALRQLIAEGRGAGRLAKLLAGFFGVTTAAAIVAKWGGLLAWLGSK